MPDPRWYGGGLRFECTACGNCCRAREGYAYVYLTTPETLALAAHLGLTPGEFRARHCAQEDGWTFLRTQSPDCVFLTAEGRCSVYAARPMQCRTWPFWQENLDRATWEGPVRATCPGVGQGPVYPADEIEAIAARNEAWYESDGEEC